MVAVCLMKVFLVNFGMFVEDMLESFRPFVNIDFEYF